MTVHDCKTTQSLLAAVDSCSRGDTIQLGEGVFSLPCRLYFPHDQFALRGNGSGRTILRSPGAVITYFSGRESLGEIAVEGLTLESGFHDGPGLGFAGEMANLAFVDVVFEDHKCPFQLGYSGGAVSARWGRVSFDRCVFRGNRADLGGAVALTDCESVSFTSCHFGNNSAARASDIFLVRPQRLDIRGCTFGFSESGGARVEVETDGLTSTEVNIYGSLFVEHPPVSTGYPALLQMNLANNVFPPRTEATIESWSWSKAERLELALKGPRAVGDVCGVPAHQYVESRIGVGNQITGNLFEAVILSAGKPGAPAIVPEPVRRLPPGAAPSTTLDVLGTRRSAQSTIGCFEVTSSGDSIGS